MVNRDGSWIGVWWRKNQEEKKKKRNRMDVLKFGKII